MSQGAHIVRVTATLSLVILSVSYLKSSTSSKIRLYMHGVQAEDAVEILSSSVNDLGESDLPSPSFVNAQTVIEYNQHVLKPKLLAPDYIPVPPTLGKESSQSAQQSLLDSEPKPDNESNKNLEADETLSSLDSSYDRVIEKFSAWASDYAGIVSKVEIKHFNHGRGVAAASDVASGDILLSVPFESLVSKASIEKDSILQPILGHKASIENGFNDEFLLLSIFLLYHRSIGESSPISAYIDILRTAPFDGMPFMWSDEKLNDVYPDPSNHIRLLTQDILDRIKELYDIIIPFLVENSESIYSESTKFPATRGDEMFSFHNFKWAFAVLNSRHWHLPCYDLEELFYQTENKSSHIFLAPFADLVNFGPPCAKGLYNDTTRTFDIVATCDLISGQEVTFWYTDACEDHVIANYGFSHYLIKRCLTSKELYERNNQLEFELEDALGEIEELKAMLRSCPNSELHKNNKPNRDNLESMPSRQLEQRVRGSHGGIRKKPSEL